jgi:hypothetical protein
VNAKSICGAPGNANSFHDLLRNPSVEIPAISSCFNASGRGVPVGLLPALYAVNVPPIFIARWFRIASARIDRAEFPVHKNKTL